MARELLLRFRFARPRRSGRCPRLRTSGQAPDASSESESTPAADSIGEALFLDTRFAEFFAANMTGVNSPLPSGDPVVAEVQTSSGALAGPFAGQSINCRS